MKRLIYESRFSKSWKRLKKKNYSEEELKKAINCIIEGTIPNKYKDHALSGNFKGYRECHIRDNWLLIYRITDSEVILLATGTHDDLFK